ncbi:Heat shock protein. Metallo peptidase. MEROPS family M48B [Desulfurella multipotens]|uniref:Protease HtpX homolog n=1 Tax=Desulfurella multipotens TaxID=79269 RepID=A0A1G6RCK3_9BACT|nr:zinc metalloprotease HtpX [Desulfurella multipotens]SDD02278.1 Heat shock protein. Metallo peptidase. MEROPS family M48B [Desulfurella multipotens]
MNYFKTFMLMFALTVLLMLVGDAIGGSQGLIIALIFAGIMNFITYWFSDKIVLKAYHAIEANQHQYPQLYSIVNNLAQKANLPMPKIYVVNSNTPNAFATGRNPKNAAICVTTGILNLLNTSELSGVLGHELTHVKNRDILTATLAATIAGAISYLAWMAQWSAIFGGMGNNRRNNNMFSLLFVAILTPIIATIIQLAISRQREYAADKGGAILSGNPMYLASALKKLESANKLSPMPNTHFSQTTAHMFIVNPFKGETFKSLFSTHPPIEKRIERLENRKIEID